MNTQLLLVADERGFTVQLSTTQRTQAGALARFTELLAQLTQEQRQREAMASVGAAIASQPRNCSAGETDAVLA